MFFTLLMTGAQTHSVESSRYRCHDILSSLLLFLPRLMASDPNLHTSFLSSSYNSSHDHCGCKGILVIVVLGVKAVYFYDEV